MNAIAFLPTQDVVNGYERLLTIQRHEAEPLMEYFGRNYVLGYEENGVQIPPLFEPSI